MLILETMPTSLFGKILIFEGMLDLDFGGPKSSLLISIFLVVNDYHSFYKASLNLFFKAYQP